MVHLDALSLGLLLALAGGVLFLLAARFAMRTPAAVPEDANALATAESLQDHGDAVLVIQAGGRVISANRRARLLFHLRSGEQPNLERLAKLVRPADAFLNLCASQSQDRFVLDGRLVECTSYRLPVQPNSLVIVSLRDPGLTASLAGNQGGLSSGTLQTFVELTQAMAASLELSTTIQTILENIEKLVPADWMEITVWDPNLEVLTPYRFTGMEGVGRKLDMPAVRYHVGEGYSGMLAKERQPILLPDIDARTDIRPAVDPAQIPLRSYLGVPLMVGKEFIGTLELASLTSGAFRPEDLEVIRMLSGQAAVAIHNALQYQAEQQRSAELSGLAQLSQAFGSTRDPKTLFSRLVQSIMPLIHVEILGFLLYNDIQRLLEGQPPFFGLPEQFLELYRIPVQPNSPLEQALMDQDVLITENAAEDPNWEAMGLGPAARGASLRETVLVPLNSGGRMLGYLQASNHTQSGVTFTQDELHLLVIVANQAAPVIDNLTLIQQSRQRAQRAEALRRVASLASSAANLDEILKFSLQELARLLQADVAGVFLLDQNTSELRFQVVSMFGSLEALPDRLSSLRMDNPQFHFTVTGSQRALNTGALSEEAAIIPFYQAIQGFWGIESVVIAPLVVRDEGIGELWLASRETNYFDKGSMQVAATAAGQLAGVVEQSVLVAQTDESLRRRVEQLTALNRISRELSTSLDYKYLLQLVYDEALLTTRADCGTILMFDLDRPSPGGPRTRFFIGDPPGRELEPLEKEALDRNEPVNVHDAAQAGYAVAHEGVQSALLVPIAYHQRQAGLMVLHSRLPNRFDSTAVEISQSLAVQAAVVLGNALQYQEQAQQGEVLKRELDTLGKLFDVSRSLRPDLPLADLLRAVTKAIQAATPFQMVVVSLFEPEGRCLRRAHAEGISDEAWQELQSRTQLWSAVQSFFQPEYKVGGIYYIPADRRPQNPVEMHTVTVLPEMDGEKEEKESDVWNAHDLLLVPLLSGDGSPLGLISVDAPRDGRRPDWQTFEALELFALQAALMIQNNHYAGALAAQTSRLEEEARRWEKEATSAGQQLPGLLQKAQEQTGAIESLERQLERTRSGLEVAEQANRQPNSLAVLMTVARELLARFGMQVALLAEKTPSGPRMLDVIGSLPAGANPKALFGQRNPLRQMLQDGSLMLAADLENDPDWRGNAFLNALNARSFIGLPLVLNDRQTAGVLVVGLEPLPTFSEEDRQSFAQVARQVGVGLQNLELLNQTRRRLQEMDTLLDFSRKLGSFTPDGILHSLVDSALAILPAAQAGWAGLWDEKAHELVPQVASGYADNASITGMHLTRLATLEGAALESLPLPLRAYLTGQPLCVQDVQFARDYNLPADDLMRYRRAAGGRLPVSTQVEPIKLGEHILGVLVLENFSSQAVFSAEDENLALSLAQQAALALENARLLQSAEQRAAQLLALTRVAGMITSSLRSEDLIALLPGQLAEVLPYDTATLWLRSGEMLSVAAASGFENNAALLGISVALEDSQLFEEMIATGRPLCVPDVRLDARFPSLTEQERVSWLGIPLVAKGVLTGVIAIEKTEAGFYTEEHLRAATTFASQAAVALENARLFEESERRAGELDERSRRLALLNRLSGDLGATLDADYILRLTAQELLKALDVTRVAAVMVADDGQCLLRAEVPTSSDTLPLALPAVPLFERLQESRGLFSSADASAEPELAPLVQSYLAPRGICSLLVIPLLSGSNLHGWLLLQTAQEYHFTTSEMELARTICNQAATAIQNARLFAETRSLTEDLERRVVERTGEVTREHHNSQTLLQIISELSSSLDMGLVLNRTLTVLNESLGSQQSLVVLSQGIVRVYNAGEDLVGLRTDNARNHARYDLEIARWVVNQRKPALVSDALADPRWSTSETLAYRSVLAVPLVLGEDVLGSLLLFHPQPAFFDESQVHLMEAAARQISIAFNNADLFSLIRDQAEHLGGMLREQQVEASRSRAILEAVADGVLVTLSNNAITLFNASAETILDLTSEQVVGQSLDQFSGLFGKAASTWMQTIRRWSSAGSLNQEGETYSEQLQLDNGRVVSVHLAPVILRSEFLGTVSIFRDITHEVQVDRLKTEFVANVSHELRTPMTSIKGYVDIMLLGAAGDLDPRARHFLQIVKGNTERLSVLVNDLLDVSKIESGRVTLSMQALDLNELANDVISDITRRSREENKPMAFRLDIPADLPRVTGDLERVRQVIGNLVSNGYNYTPEGGEVILHMHADEQEVTVDVQDNGIGIGSQDQRRIFERFYRGEDPLVLATAGTGLGLAITRYLIEMHGGRIWFTSSGVRGEGSTFSFTLPVYAPSAPEQG